MKYEKDGIIFECDVDIDEQEADNYIVRAKAKNKNHISAHIDGEYIELTYSHKEYIPFERIRRITGYLVGSLERFNDAKRSEEAERVKHSI